MYTFGADSKFSQIIIDAVYDVLATHDLAVGSSSKLVFPLVSFRVDNGYLEFRFGVERAQRFSLVTEETEFIHILIGPNETPNSLARQCVYESHQYLAKRPHKIPTSNKLHEKLLDYKDFYTRLGNFDEMVESCCLAISDHIALGAEVDTETVKSMQQLPFVYVDDEYIVAELSPYSKYSTYAVKMDGKYIRVQYNPTAVQRKKLLEQLMK